jgi:acyl-CoA dehydrogenase
MAEHCFAARMAAQMCFQAKQLPLEPLRVAVAKARTSEAALEVASLSHSVHGAIGFTAEYDLQIYTRRLHVWRQTAGSESYWHDMAGAYVTNSKDASLDILRSATDFITT